MPLTRWIDGAEEANASQGRQPSLPAPRCMNIPCRWNGGGLGDFAGRVRFVRRFGLPRQLDSYERIWITFAEVSGRAGIWLNGRLLGHREGAAGAFEFEVTALLQDRNELTVEIEDTTGNGGLSGEVALEIRCPAYLRSTRAWSTVDNDRVYFHAAGEVVGASEKPLDLYLIHGRANVGYALVTASGEGEPFQLDSEGISARCFSGPSEILRLELVSGPVVWYAVELPATR